MGACQAAGEERSLAGGQRHGVLRESSDKPLFRSSAPSHHATLGSAFAAAVPCAAVLEDDAAAAASWDEASDAPTWSDAEAARKDEPSDEWKWSIAPYDFEAVTRFETSSSESGGEDEWPCASEATTALGPSASWDGGATPGSLEKDAQQCMSRMTTKSTTGAEAESFETESIEQESVASSGNWSVENGFLTRSYDFSECSDDTWDFPLTSESAEPVAPATSYTPVLPLLKLSEVSRTTRDKWNPPNVCGKRRPSFVPSRRGHAPEARGNQMLKKSLTAKVRRSLTVAEVGIQHGLQIARQPFPAY